ncbi:MAG: tetratricopeptide repeat protein, partial [Candidatus Bathyarchaeota archaeon]|nr:tetratricopeptide repeat protein [Candidatus Bathyarchaeota archaeon]
MSASIEEVLGEATRLEKEYEWLQASELYEQALGMVDEEDYFRRGEIQEKIGYCLQRAAFQAETQDEFMERIKKAVYAYGEAQRFYESLIDEKISPWILRCEALTKYLSFWLASKPSERRTLLEESSELGAKALTAFWGMGEKLEFSRTYNELLFVYWRKSDFVRNRDEFRDTIESGINWGEKAVDALSELDDPYEKSRANYSLAIFLNLCAYYIIAEPEKQDHTSSEAIKHFRETLELYEKAGDDYTTGLSLLWLGSATARQSPRAYEFGNKAFECGKKTRDNLLKGIALHYQAYNTYWEAIATDDPEHRIELAEEAIELYDRSQQHYSLFNYPLLRGGKIGSPTPGGHAEYYLDRSGWETDQDKKMEFLEKSERAGRKALEAAEDSDIPGNVGRMCHILSRTLTDRAKLEQDVDVKRRLLEEALTHRERNIEIWENITFFYWNLGVYYNLLGHIKSELAFIQPDLDGRDRLLEDSVSTMEKSLNNIDKSMPSLEKRGLTWYFASQNDYQNDYGAALSRLYEATKKPEHLRKAIEIWHDAIESAKKLELVSRIAESYWKIAKTQDALGEHLEAANNFQLASANFSKATEKIPQLKGFYQDYGEYMLAWSEIENAKHHHAEKRYGEAVEHYEKAAKLHESTERWSYLTPNYLAWARLDEAEDLSRREQTQEARDLFQQAAKLFREAQESIRTKLSTIEAVEERQIADDLVKASEVRGEYCLGRVALEEARILDRLGDHLASSIGYGQAVERFQGVIDSFELESDRRELRPIIYLSRAWQKTMLAEEEMSSSLYSEAAGLFIEAREHALDQTQRLLAQAHSSFCRALEAGTEFEITRDTALFSDAKRHIEAATSHYLRAGHKPRSDYARATGRLLDAYLYTYNAQTEADPKKRAQFYQMAERLLQSSAGAYIKAKHPEKSDEIRLILESVKEEREIAVSLSDVLHAPTIVSTTTSFSTPTPTHEQAVGLERFENADIQANFIARRREVGVGEDLDLEIELVNAGKAPAQLVKVEDIVIEGFELKSFPDICRVED